MFMYEYICYTCLEYDDIDIHVETFYWFMLDLKLHDDLSLKLMISTCNMMSLWLIMLMKCLVSWLGMLW